MIDKNSTTVETMKVLSGTSVLSGIEMGKVCVLNHFQEINDQYSNEFTGIDKEKLRLKGAYNAVKNEYKSALKVIFKDEKETISILKSELMILEDDYFLNQIHKNIENEINAENSVINEFLKSESILRQAADPIIREKYFEFENIKKKILFHLQNINIKNKIEKNSIIVAHSITPIELVQIKKKNVKAIITEIGGITSHFVILARSYKIPTIIGVANATELVKNNDIVIVDAIDSEIIINPNEEEINLYKKKIAEIKKKQKLLLNLNDQPTKTKDNHIVSLWCNINNDEDIDESIKLNSDGLGLVRTETLVMKYGKLPSVEEQYKNYIDIAEKSHPKQVIFRAFDLGSDKYLDDILTKEENPALGLRGIRYLLKNTELFANQLKAILMASKLKNVKLMLPMISSICEVRKANELINIVKAELISKGVEFDDKLPIGIMIETPAAAIIANDFAQIVDFFSIGTNDLVQYVLAADRTNEQLSEYFNQVHISILRIIQQVANAGIKHKIPVAICGELAGYSNLTDIFIGLGINELSVAPSSYLEIKEKVLSINYEEAIQNANSIINNEINCDFIKY